MTIEEMEAKRHDLYADYILAIGKPEEKEIQRKLELMDEILDAAEDYETEEETGCVWDTWEDYLLDLQIDMAREDALAYER